MPYVVLADPEIGEVFTSQTATLPTPWNQIAANFEAGIPGIYAGAGAGRLALGTGLMTLDILDAPTLDNRTLVCDNTTLTGWAWKSGTIPLGMIIIWSGSVISIPTGWSLCDGTQGGPDLRGFFVRGFGSTFVGDFGGAETMNLSHIHNQNDANTSSVGGHTHTQAATGSDGAHDHTAAGTTGGPSTTYAANWMGTGDYGATADHTHDLAGASVGGNHTHTNPDTDGEAAHSHASGAIATALSAAQSKMPPYYALCFIQRTS
jgi:hypothetical protein